MLSPGSTQPPFLSRNMPLSTDPRPLPTGISHRCSPIGRAPLSLLLSPTMLVATTASLSAPDVHRPFFYWYDHLRVHLTTEESLDSAPLPFIVLRTIRCAHVRANNVICIFLFKLHSCVCAPTSLASTSHCSGLAHASPAPTASLVDHPSNTLITI